MKTPPYRTEQCEAIATFGQANLIRRGFENDYELVGGSEGDRQKAKEWIALFMKDCKVRGIEKIKRDLEPTVNKRPDRIFAGRSLHS